MFRRAFVGAVVLGLVSFAATQVMAATVNGTVESVSADDNTDRKSTRQNSSH